MRQDGGQSQPRRLPSDVGLGCMWSSPGPQLGASGSKSRGYTLVCFTTRWCFSHLPHLVGFGCHFPRPPCGPGTLLMHFLCIAFVFSPQHRDGYTANEGREAQRGGETYPSLHSSDKARICLRGLDHCPILPCQKSGSLSLGTRDPQGLVGRKELNPHLWIPPDLHLGLSRAALPIKASWARLQGPGILLPQRSLSWGLWDSLDPLGPAFQLPPVA